MGGNPSPPGTRMAGEYRVTVTEIMRALPTANERSDYMVR